MKRIKDPIYGYISIDEHIFFDIIDTACFQRLRNIRQTSYIPLYPASFHNRFIHSLGVYHLGQIAIRAVEVSLLTPDFSTFTKDAWKRYKELFELACLLHDVGHAPFSHTGEDFYWTSSPSIRDHLCNIVDDADFTKDAQERRKGKEAAAHEIMSCIVALETFSEHFRDKSEKDFFVRCITGYLYTEPLNDQTHIKNCLIQLLNSPIIDVDRLDYIIRDAQTIGFQSVSIDISRLLNGLCIIEYKGKKCLAYDKSALTVIENVIYAHDSEKKWIQNHPVILYEHFLLQHAMRIINQNYRQMDETPNIFSYPALTEIGTKVQGNESSLHISLLADEDVLFIMKNICSDDLIKEFFARKLRRHPIWKSEAEYRTLFDIAVGGGRKLEELENDFREIERYLVTHNELYPIPVINETTLNTILEEERKVAEAIRRGQVSEKDYPADAGISKVKKWALCLREIANECDIPFDFVIVCTNKFQSNFLKTELEKILIHFQSLDSVECIKDVSSILSSQTNREKLFYLFYNDRAEDGSKKKIDRKLIANKLFHTLFR